MTKLEAVASWCGRKFIALVFVGFLAVAAAAIVRTEKVSPVEITLAALYTAFVSGHAATEVMANKSKTTPKTADKKAQSQEEEGS